MPRTEEQKIKHRIACKKYRDSNKEQISIASKKYYDENIEIIREKGKLWSNNYRLNNKDKIAIASKKYYDENHKELIIKQWKKYGIICDDYQLIYGIYMDTNNCDFCHKIFKNSLDRHLDHNHSITESYNIRGILCRECNTKDLLAGYPVKEYPLD